MFRVWEKEGTREEGVNEEIGRRDRPGQGDQEPGNEIIF